MVFVSRTAWVGVGDVTSRTVCESAGFDSSTGSLLWTVFILPVFARNDRACEEAAVKRILGKSAMAAVNFRGFNCLESLENLMRAFFSFR